MLDRFAVSLSPSAMMCFRNDSPIIAAIVPSIDDTDVLCSPLAAITSVRVLPFVDFFLLGHDIFYSPLPVIIFGVIVFTALFDRLKCQV